MMYRSIAQLTLGRPLRAVSPGTSVREACRILETEGLDVLAVVEGGKLVGILSERDVICRAVARSLPCDATTVGRIMTPDPVTIDENESLSAAQDRMAAARCRHLPVMRAGEPVSMISMRDVPTEDRMMHERFRKGRQADQRLH